MSDITKCKGTNCPLKDNCKRYLDEADNLYQSFFMEIPFENNECEYFLNINYDTRVSNDNISL